MKLLVTADLHVDIARSRAPAEKLAAKVKRSNADALLIVGDIAGRNLEDLEDGLRLFDEFGGLKMFVAGNHDIWTHGESSLERYETHIPEIAQRCDFHFLDCGPAYLDGVAFVGSVGWYDYAFAPNDRRLPERFYEAKVTPAAAERVPEHNHLLHDRNDLADWMFALGSRWMDGVHVRLGMSDHEFCDRLIEKLEAHLADATARADSIIAAVHHIPFGELVDWPADPRRDFVRAFMGSPRFGETLTACERVQHVFTGHSHLPGRIRKPGLVCTNIGSTYVAKRLEKLDTEKLFVRRQSPVQNAAPNEGR